MLDRVFSWIWVNHPRLGKPDAMLTLAVLATLTCIVKFLFNEVTFVVHGMTVNCGHVDSLAYGALLTPTLGAYAARKWKDSPDKKDGPNGNP